MEHIRVCTYDGPGAQPVIRTVPWPTIPKKAALIKVGACGVCGTDLHILKGHWPKQLPWPFTLGHEIGGVLVEVGSEFTEDFMSKPLTVGSKVMIPPLMPCGHCYYCVHYPESANKCLTPVYYGRYLGFDKAPHLWGGWAEYVYVDLEMLPGTKIYKLPDDMSLRLGALSEPLTSCIRAFNRATRAGGLRLGRHRGDPGLRPDRNSGGRRRAGDGRGPRDLRRRAGDAAARSWRASSARKPLSTSRRSRRRKQRIKTRARHRRRLRRRPRDGLLGSSERRPRRHRNAARRRHLCRDGPVHRCRLDHDVLAPHLHQGPQRARVVGIHRQRSAARRRHALSHPQQISLARDADAVSVFRGRASGARWRTRWR